jgi:hypothetical protein
MLILFTGSGGFSQMLQVLQGCKLNVPKRVVRWPRHLDRMYLSYNLLSGGVCQLHVPE